MPETKEAAQTAASDVKSTVNTAKGAVQTVKTIKDVAQVAATVGEASNPAGWVMLAAKFAPVLNKIKNQLRKLGLGAAAIGAYLLYLLGMKIVGAITGLVFGAVTGAPLLLIPGAGPFLYAGWTAYWTYKGWVDPFGTIHLATHPWELITKPLSGAWHYVSSGFSKAGSYTIASIKGSSSTVAGGISSGASTAAGSFLSGLTWVGSAIWGGISSALGTAAGAVANAASALWGAITGGISVSTTAVAVPVLTAVGSVIVTGVIFQANLGASFSSLQTDKNTIPPPGITGNAQISKTVNPTTISNTDATNGINVDYTITLTAATALQSVVIYDLTIVNPSGGAPFVDFQTDTSGNQINSFTVGNMTQGQVYTKSYTIKVQGSQYNDSIINNIAVANYTIGGTPETVRAGASVVVGTAGQPGKPGNCAAPPQPAQGTATTPQQIQCYISQQAAGKIEPITGHPLDQVMLNVMSYESSGNQCSSGSYGEIGVFQYTASTWQGTGFATNYTDSGSTGHALVCWGIPGPDPYPYAAPLPNTDFRWDLVFQGANYDGGAWDPFTQVDATVKLMLNREATRWTTFECLYFAPGTRRFPDSYCANIPYIGP